MNVRRASGRVQRACPAQLPEWQSSCRDVRQLFLRLLVRADDLRLLQDVPLNRSLQGWLVWLPEIFQGRVERVELEEVAMSADWRARAAVTDVLPIVLSLARSWGQRTRPLGESLR